ncbi:MAG: 3-deoxy-D-manno-octulosonic acid transferase, partial [Alphaproteobacteria bacterium]|nr:3-deoxy-D-manno-octulosonic acid transferase [Alphaproteobacteria bacterium]
WLHAASVGESVSLLPLIARIADERPALTPLITTGTVTSAQMMAEQLPPGAIHQYVPVDLPRPVARFLDHWRPDLGIWVESELWPNALTGLHRRGIPALMVNGRMSAKSHGRWQKLRSMAKSVVAPFALVLGQSQVDGDRFTSLGARDVRALGNLKAAAPPLAADPDALAAMEKALGDRPRWLAASTHLGEETMAGAIHGALAPDHPGLITLIAPRHPNRGPEIAKALTAQGLNVGLGSRGDVPGPGTDIFIADSLGQMGLWFRLAQAVFVGGSFGDYGGHNPLEPARLECALVFGPDMANAQDLADGLVAQGGAVRVADQHWLQGAIGGLLASPELTAQRGAAAASYANGQARVLDATMDAITPWLDDASQSHPKI